MKQISLAVDVVRSGGVIAYPTESVFGLGCDPFNENAVEKLLQMKQRSTDQGLILVASHLHQVLPLIRPVEAIDLTHALKTWPGHYTWVFPPSETVPAWITGRNKGIAIRLSKHPVVVQLCAQLNHPLVSTSANLSNQDDLNSIKDIKIAFGDKIGFYIDAPVGNAKNPSTIQDAHTLKTYR